MFKVLSKKRLITYYKNRSVAITGANGFVGSYLIPGLTEVGAIVHGIDRKASSKITEHTHHRCDLFNLDEVSQCITRIEPEIVFHLASQSSVGTAWKQEWETIETNAKITYNLFKSLEEMGTPVRVLLVSSGEVYGDRGHKKSVETDPLRPVNPYSVSKAMMEMIAHRFRNTNVEYIIVRPYNHTGPGRQQQFFEASVMKQFAVAAKKGKNAVQINVGDVDVVRDYSDVRDVVEKYLQLIPQGKIGEAYNICSGIGLSLKDIIHRIEKISKVRAEIKRDISKIRENDIKYFVGKTGYVKLRNRFSFEDTLRDIWDSYVA